MKPLSRLDFFGSHRPLVKASAPGRLDVMGGIADYSGSLVLEMPIRERTQVWAARREDGQWRAYSREAERPGMLPMAQARTSDLATPRKAKSFIKKNKKISWAAYVLGSVPLLLQKKNFSKAGADLYLTSNVPFAKGLSSSAAAEVASLEALRKLFHLSFRPKELPALCQQVENQIVGAPCGLMDQLTCYLGKENRLLPILCQPDKVFHSIPIPSGIQFIGLDSGVRHWVGGSSYQDVRTAAFMGYSLIAMKAGATRKELIRAQKSGNFSRLPYQGYLCRISPSRFESRYASLLPAAIQGSDFLRSCASIDQATAVKPKTTYLVQTAARHPIYENARVQAFKKMLASLRQAAHPQKRKKLLFHMGQLMYQSHASYSACGLGEPVTDRIVKEAQKAGPRSGIYGAKITGGGSGGTVCLLIAGRRGLQTARRIAVKIVKSPHSFITA